MDIQQTLKVLVQEENRKLRLVQDHRVKQGQGSAGWGCDETTHTVCLSTRGLGCVYFSNMNLPRVPGGHRFVDCVSRHMVACRSACQVVALWAPIPKSGPDWPNGESQCVATRAPLNAQVAEQHVRNSHRPMCRRSSRIPWYRFCQGCKPHSRADGLSQPCNENFEDGARTRFTGNVVIRM